MKKARSGNRLENIEAKDAHAVSAGTCSHNVAGFNARARKANEASAATNENN